MLRRWVGGNSGCVSAEELARLRGFPEINRAELIRYFTLTGADEAFVRQFRTGRNVLGVAVQLCTLPWLGFVPDEVALAPDAVVGRLSQRLGIAMGELRGYGEREQTRTDHLREVAGYAGWRSMDTAEWKDLDEFLFARAMGRRQDTDHDREIRTTPRPGACPSGEDGSQPDHQPSSPRSLTSAPKI